MQLQEGKNGGINNNVRERTLKERIILFFNPIITWFNNIINSIRQYFISRRRSQGDQQNQGRQNQFQVKKEMQNDQKPDNNQKPKQSINQNNQNVLNNKQQATLKDTTLTTPNDILNKFNELFFSLRELLTLRKSQTEIKIKYKEQCTKLIIEIITLICRFYTGKKDLGDIQNNIIKYAQGCNIDAYTFVAMLSNEWSKKQGLPESKKVTLSTAQIMLMRYAIISELKKRDFLNTDSLKGSLAFQKNVSPKIKFIYEDTNENTKNIFVKNLDTESYNLYNNNNYNGDINIIQYNKKQKQGVNGVVQKQQNMFLAVTKDKNGKTQITKHYESGEKKGGFNVNVPGRLIKSGGKNLTHLLSTDIRDAGRGYSKYRQQITELCKNNGINVVFTEAFLSLPEPREFKMQKYIDGITFRDLTESIIKDVNQVRLGNEAINEGKLLSNIRNLSCGIKEFLLQVCRLDKIGIALTDTNMRNIICEKDGSVKIIDTDEIGMKSEFCDNEVLHTRSILLYCESGTKYSNNSIFSESKALFFNILALVSAFPPTEEVQKLFIYIITSFYTIKNNF